MFEYLKECYKKFLFDLKMLKVSYNLHICLLASTAQDFFTLLDAYHLKVRILDDNKNEVSLDFFYGKINLITIILNKKDFTYYLKHKKNIPYSNYHAVPYFFTEKKEYDLSFIFDELPRLKTMKSIIEMLSFESCKDKKNTQLFKEIIFGIYPYFTVYFYDKLKHIEITDKNKKDRYVIIVNAGYISVSYYPFNRNRSIRYQYYYQENLDTANLE